MFRIRATYLPRKDMVFDLDHYFREHIPLARKITAGKVNIRRMGVELNAALLLEDGVTATPCVLCVDVDSMEDVAAFRRLLQSDDVEPLRKDVPRYTNCTLEWTVSEIRDV